MWPKSGFAFAADLSDAQLAALTEVLEDLVRNADKRTLGSGWQYAYIVLVLSAINTPD